MEKILLNDGNSIPSVGFGVFRIPNDGSTYRAVRMALDAGYRHIDTAAAYFNEAEAGKAVKDSGVPREEVFVTSKLWLQDYGFAAARSGTERSLKNSGSTTSTSISCTSLTATCAARGKRWKRQKGKDLCVRSASAT